MPFQIIRNDITRVKADAIVNTANPKPVIGGGTDSAIYKAAGEEQLLAERKKIGNIEPGQAVSTPAFKLNAKYIIHTVGPAWIDGNHGERETLHSCYANSMALADELNCESIAFPMIATGIYGFPKDEALNIALEEIEKFLRTHEMDITLVVFDKKALKLSENLVGEIDRYIDEHTVGRLSRREYGYNNERSRRRREIEDDECRVFDISIDAAPADPESPEAPQHHFMHDLSEKDYKEDDRSEYFEDKLVGAADITYFRDEYASPTEAPKTVRPLFSFFSKKAEDKLDKLLKKKEDTFQQRLFKLIDERKLDDVTVYKRANIDKKVFSKIRCNVNYHPKKKTALAFAIALHLDMAEMKDLLSRAEYALSPSSDFDLIISYFVENKIYDIYEINTALYSYTDDYLGN